MKVELEELQQKRKKLAYYLRDHADSIDENEQCFMKRQIFYMTEYIESLQSRINYAERKKKWVWKDEKKHDTNYRS